MGFGFFFFLSRPSGARNLHNNTNKTSLKINWCFWLRRNSWDFQIWPMGTTAQAFSRSILEPKLSPKNKILQSSLTKEPLHDSRNRRGARIQQSIKQPMPGRRAEHEAHPTSSRAGLASGCLPSHVGYHIPSPPTSQQVGVSLWSWLSSPSFGSRTLSWREHRYPAFVLALDAI